MSPLSTNAAALSRRMKHRGCVGKRLLEGYLAPGRQLCRNPRLANRDPQIRDGPFVISVCYHRPKRPGRIPNCIRSAQ
jgi:hypothetical protein